MLGGLLGTLAAFQCPSSALAEEAAAAKPGSLAARIATGGSVQQPGIQPPWAPKQLYYPRWMFGEWQVRLLPPPVSSGLLLRHGCIATLRHCAQQWLSSAPATLMTDCKHVGCTTKSLQVEMEFTAVRTPLGREFVPPGFLQVLLAWQQYPQQEAASSAVAHARPSPESHSLPPPCCLPPLLSSPPVQAAEASAEEGGLGSRYSFRQRFYSTLPPTLDNQLRVGGGLGR